MRKGEKIYREALIKWGKESQMRQTLEELTELQLAILKNLRGYDNIENLAEEVADVEIMLEQLKYIHNIASKVEENKEYKLQRLENRLKNAR